MHPEKTYHRFLIYPLEIKLHLYSRTNCKNHPRFIREEEHPINEYNIKKIKPVY